MRENIVFDYLLANAWGLPLCRVSVSEDGFVQCQENRENTQGLQLEKAEVDKIKSIVSEHAHILDYDSKELESPDVFDGVMNFFDFEASDGRKVNLMAFNIGEVKTPGMSFSKGLLEKGEPDEIVVDGVELEAAVITHGKTGAIDYSPGTDENADRHRNLFFVNQVIEYDRRIELHAVQIEKQAGGLSRIVLSRHIDPIFALGAGINLRIVEREMQYFALRNAGLYLRVGIGRIAQVRLILRQRKTMRHDQRQRGQNESFHHIRLS